MESNRDLNVGDLVIHDGSLLYLLNDFRYFKFSIIKKGNCEYVVEINNEHSTEAELITLNKSLQNSGTILEKAIVDTDVVNIKINICKILCQQHVGWVPEDQLILL